ncbi:MAG: acetylornithine deacetylase [bacterium]|nr:acetylornithine deacetylase [bacterium]
MSAANRSILSDAELLGRLVSFDSTSKLSNLPLAEFLCDYLDRPGIRIERNPSPDGDKVNLVVTVGPEVDPGSRSGLVLSGHMDVVPAAEPEWRSDPFELTETATAYVGRGACDMKGFVALAVDLAASIEPQRLRRPLVLILTYDEELGCIGAHRLVETWPRERPLPRYAIIGEPTSLEAVRMHKGHATLRLTVNGRSAHSGYPHLGHNAIEPAGRAVHALAELRRSLERESWPNREHFPEVPHVALNVARVRGGTAVNVVPDRCVVDLGLRVLPGMEAGPITDRVRAAVEAVLEGEDFALELINESPPLLLDEGSEIYREVCGLVGQRRTLSASYATDAGWLQSAGLECLLFGPGNIEVAHRPNESLSKDEFRRAAELLRQLVDRFCVA